MQKSSNFPHARQAGLLTTPCQTELLVYDLESDQAHCLNHSAALIWQACDGQTSRADLRQRLLKESQLELDQTELEQCLAQLAERRLLLLASTTPPAATPGATAAVLRAVGQLRSLGRDNLEVHVLGCPGELRTSHIRASMSGHLRILRIGVLATIVLGIVVIAIFSAPKQSTTNSSGVSNSPSSNSTASQPTPPTLNGSSASNCTIFTI